MSTFNISDITFAGAYVTAMKAAQHSDCRNAEREVRARAQPTMGQRLSVNSRYWSDNSDPKLMGDHKMRNLIGLFVAMAFVLALSLESYAQNFDVSPTAGDQTVVDLSLLDGYLRNAQDGDLISASMRRVLNAALGESGILLDGLLTDDGYLLLDDGSSVLVADGDRVTLRPKGAPTTIMVGCVLRVGPSGEHTLKRIIPACRRVCSDYDHESLAPICTQVPPRIVEKKL